MADPLHVEARRVVVRKPARVVLRRHKERIQAINSLRKSKLSSCYQR